MRLIPQLVAASRRGLVRGTEGFVAHAVRNVLLILLAVGVLWFTWGYISEWIGGWFHLPQWFGWPDISLPNWFGSEEALPAPETPVPAASEAVDQSCNGWGYKNWCWKDQ